MDYDAILAAALALLQQEQRLSYRVLKLRLQLDDDTVEALKEDLIYAKQLAVDEDGRVLVWTGQVDPAPPSSPRAPQPVPPPAMPEHPLAQVASAYATPHPPDAERRQLTVLFCDLVGSTTLAGQLDPEDLREVIRAYQAACAEVIQRFDGHIAQYLGDGLLVYFGYPQAHEDDAQRAVRTGLGIVEAIGTLNARLAQDIGIRLAVRLGIHTGLVVVGEIGGEGRQEQLALGETPNVAARLQGLAQPDTVVISEATSELIQGYFTLDDRGVQPLKGVTTAVQLYQVLGVSGVQSRLDVLSARGLTPLVGREAELTLLRERWAQVQDGLGQVVMLSGEAGIGKSRLVRVLTERLVDENTPPLTLRCSPYHTTSAFYPVIDYLQRLLQWHRDASPVARLATLEQALRTAGLPLAEMVPLLATLLTLPVPERYPPPTLAPQRQKQKTQEALVAWLLVDAARQPVLAVWEDLHWADPSTLELLGLLLDHVPTTRLLLVLTYRPEFRPPWAPRSYVTPLPVTRLTRPQSEEMVLRVTGGKPVPSEVLAQVVAKTDGIPLFVEELVKTILEAGLMQAAAGRYVLRGPLLPLAIPATLQDALMARLDRLAPVKDVAQLGAVLGREFTYELLRAVAPLDEVTLLQALAQLMEAELLYQRGVPPQATYLFKHALIQEAAYQSLLRSTRQQYHQRIAQALEALFHDRLEEHYGLLAHHYCAAGDLEKALDYHHRAAHACQRVYAVEEALEHYTRALEVAATLGVGLTGGLIGDLHLQRGRVYAQTGAIAQARADFEAALEGARTADHQAGEIQALNELGFLLAGAADYRAAIPLFEAALPIAAALDDKASQVSILSRLSIVYTNRLQFDHALDYGHRALVLARALGDKRTLALAMDSLEVAAAMIGDFPTIEAIAPQLADIHRHHGDLWYLQFALYQWCYGPIGAGRWGDAMARLEEALAINRRIGDHGNEPLYLATLSWIHRSHGNYQQALVNGRQAVALSEELGHAEWTAWSEAFLGWTLLEVYALEEAVRHLERGAEAAERAGALNHLLRCVSQLAWVHWLLGEAEQARVLVEQAEAILRQITAPPGRAFIQGAYAYAAVARVRLADGEAERAYQLLAPMLAAAEACGWQEAIAYGALVIGQCLAAHGDERGAASALQRALQVALEMGLPGVAWEAHAALANCHRAAGRLKEAENHLTQAKAIVEQLSTALDDATMRQGFLRTALSHLGRAPLQGGRGQ